MADNLFQLLKDPERYIELVEQKVARIDSKDPDKLPVISISHGPCSDYLFIDIGSKDNPQISKILVMHSSSLSIRNYGINNEEEELKQFLAESPTVVLVPIQREDRVTSRFADDAQIKANRAGHSFTTIESIFIKSARPVGWHSLIDLDREDNIVLQVGGAVELKGELQHHNLLQHIQKHLNSPKIGGIGR